MILDTSQFSNKRAIHDYIAKHQDKIIYSKKANRKNADTIESSFDIETKGAIKAYKPLTDAPDVLAVKAVINTTFLFDSHQDVHIDGIWKKSLKENKRIQHLKEHQSGLENIISDGDDLKAYAENYTFKSLGFNYKGETQALIFESNVRKDRNAFMHEQYAKAWVKEHSVGMYYINVLPAIDSKDYPTEYKTYKKYIDRIGNVEAVKEGFFFAITEAKVLEGSGVSLGSNHVTPTLSNNSEPKKFHSQETEPPKSTRRNQKNYLIL